MSASAPMPRFCIPSSPRPAPSGLRKRRRTTERARRRRSVPEYGFNDNEEISRPPARVSRRSAYDSDDESSWSDLEADARSKSSAEDEFFPCRIDVSVLRADGFKGKALTAPGKGHTHCSHPKNADGVCETCCQSLADLKRSLLEVRQPLPNGRMKPGYKKRENELLLQNIFTSDSEFQIPRDTIAKVLVVSKDRLTDLRKKHLANKRHEPIAHKHTGVRSQHRKRDANGGDLREHFVAWLEPKLVPSGRTTGITAHFPPEWTTIDGKDNSIHSAYSKEIATFNAKISARTVRDWTNSAFPNARTAKPKTAYCGTCAVLKNACAHLNTRVTMTKAQNSTTGKISVAVLKTERDRLKTQLQRHTDLAKAERSRYNDAVEASIAAAADVESIYRARFAGLWTADDVSIQLRNGFRATLTPRRARLALRILHAVALRRFELVVSADFAQSKQLPHHGRSNAPAADFFKSSLNYTVLGINIHAWKFKEKRSRRLYVAPEIEGNKTSDYIISALEHTFASLPRYLQQAKHLRIQLDNTRTTNKNYAMVAYAAHLVDVGAFANTRLEFMPCGHTKFFPDLLFALVAKFFAKADIFSEEQLLSACRSAGVVTRMTTSLLSFWRRPLQRKFFSIDGISSLHSFVFAKVGDEVELNARWFGSVTDGPPTRRSLIRPAAASIDVAAGALLYSTPAIAKHPKMLCFLQSKKFAHLQEQYKVINAGSDEDLRPPCIRYDTAADAVKHYLPSANKKWAKARTNDVAPTRPTRAAYRLSRQVDFWTPDDVHRALTDAGMPKVATALLDRRLAGKDLHTFFMNTKFAERHNLTPADCENLNLFRDTVSVL